MPEIVFHLTRLSWEMRARRRVFPLSLSLALRFPGKIWFLLSREKEQVAM